MEKALTKVGSLKVGSLWISKKAKEEFSNISEDISVWTLCIVLFFFFFFLLALYPLLYLFFVIIVTLSLSRMWFWR
jgi:uncharacterized membrane-anchored protein YitT (DUF2179 family)